MAHETMNTAGVPVKIWNRHVEIEGQARDQLRNTASMPFVFRHVAAMPDCHWGLGATVGSVVATKKAVIPAAVGVDIGCGMVAQPLELTASELPDSLSKLRSYIEQRVPVGFAHQKNRRTVDDVLDGTNLRKPLEVVHNGIRTVLRMAPIRTKEAHSREICDRQLGTLGGGNHFLEVCLDESERVWILLHSGSRNIGNLIGRYYIERAKEHIEAQKEQVPDRDLAWLDDGTNMYVQYVYAVEAAQRFAALNREIMRIQVWSALEEWLGRQIAPVAAGDTRVVNCHHNYISHETHFGEEVVVTRKGAIRAGAGELGIIPGSMGARSFIVRGKGNADSFESCSHGAGRRMSRKQAKREISLDELYESTKGVECRKDAGVLDEAPGAYKDIDAVMASQEDLVDVVHTLKQIVCVKG